MSPVQKHRTQKWQNVSECHARQKVKQLCPCILSIRTFVVHGVTRSGTTHRGCFAQYTVLFATPPTGLSKLFPGHSDRTRPERFGGTTSSLVVSLSLHVAICGVAGATFVSLNTINHSSLCNVHNGKN